MYAVFSLRGLDPCVLSRITPTPIRMERTYATVEKSLHFWRTTALRRRIDHFPVIPKRTLVTDKVTLEMSESESLRTDLDASQGMILQLFLEYIPYLQLVRERRANVEGDL